MPRTYVHELGKEVQSIAGWYELCKEERVGHSGKEFLYLVGNGVVESSCCGVGGCRYAVVPGSIVSWKSETNEEGLYTSVVEPVRDEKLQRELREIVSKKEGVTQVQFW
jgi:hypothetical protein